MCAVDYNMERMTFGELSEKGMQQGQQDANKPKEPGQEGNQQTESSDQWRSMLFLHWGGKVSLLDELGPFVFRFGVFYRSRSQSTLHQYSLRSMLTEMLQVHQPYPSHGPCVVNSHPLKTSVLISTISSYRYRSKGQSTFHQYSLQYMQTEMFQVHQPHPSHGSCFVNSHPSKTSVLISATSSSALSERLADNDGDCTTPKLTNRLPLCEAPTQTLCGCTNERIFFPKTPKRTKTSPLDPGSRPL